MEVTPEKKAILDALGASVAEKRERLMQLGMQSVYGLDEVNRMLQSMSYAQAQAALANAENDLRAELARKGDE